MEIKRLKLLKQSDYQTIFDYHKEHILHNFPDSVYRQDLFKAQLDKTLTGPRVYLFFAKEDRRVCGFLWLGIENDPYKVPRPWRYLDVHYIHVDPAFRAKGIGSQLMAFTLDFAKKHQCKEVRLGTNVNNIPAIHLYKKFGFEKYRVIMRIFL